MKDFQTRLKYHMDHGATYLEALHLLKSADNKEPSVTRKAKDEKREDCKKQTS